jgi:hypothetical protein
VIFDHGIRSIDGVTRQRFKALLDGDPWCQVCAYPRQTATSLWLNPRNGNVIPMCATHFSEYAAEADDDVGGEAT